jgi:hypothetical protein
MSPVFKPPDFRRPHDRDRISMGGIPRAESLLRGAQGLVTRGRQPEGRLEYAGEMGLIHESRFIRNLCKGMADVHPPSRKVKAAHEKVTVWTGPEHSPELSGKVIPRETRDRFEL